MARQATETRERPAQAQAPKEAPAGNLPATQDQAKPAHPLMVLKGQLEERQNEFAFALPEHMPVQRFTRVVMTAVQNNPKLLNCTRVSLFNSAMRAAQDGLLPDGVEGAIVDYKGKVDGKDVLLAQWMPMYQGILKKVRNSGEFKWMTAQVVYEGDLFRHWIDQDGEHFEHEPQGISERPTRFYAAVTTKSGGAFVEVMTMAQVAKVRAASRVKSEYGPWAKWFEEMGKKTAFRRLAKRLPKSSDLDDLIRRDDALYDFEGQREEAQVDKTERRRLTTSAAFDAFAGGDTIDHDPGTGDVGGDQDFAGEAGGDFGNAEDFGTADDRAEVLAQEAAQREQAAKDAEAEKTRKAEEARKAQAATDAAKNAQKKDDPISSGLSGDGAAAVGAAEGAGQPADGGNTSAGNPGASDEQDDDSRRWPHGAVPTNEEEYESYAETAIDDFAAAKDVAPWWKSTAEIDLRKKCGVKQATFDRLLKKAQNKVAELSKKK